MVAVVVVVTLLVFTVKVALVFPAAMVTLVGTVALAELDDSFTEMPPVGAAPVRVSFPVDVVPPLTLVGVRVRDSRVAGTTVRLAC
jgi:hypothetical protein